MKRVAYSRADQLFAYDPCTGVVMRKVTTSSRALAGSRAGSVNCDGYLVVQVDGQKFMLHRIAWLLATGRWPEGQIDHKNGERADNRLENLREATLAENLRNVRPRNPMSGAKGVYWHKRAGKWCAQIVKDGQHHYLGLFSDLDAAHATYCEAAKRLHGEFARTA